MNKKILSFFLLIALIFSNVLPVFAATKTWDFSDSSGYAFDNTKIEFSSGRAQLKTSGSPNWYDPSWTERKPVTITGSTVGAQTDYQLKITIAYDSDMQADFDDVRFTDSNGTTLLSYWLESKTDSMTADFWVKVPAIPASPSATTIYVYYGNSSANSVSNGNATFNFFDDFSTDSVFANSSWPDNPGNPIFTPGLGSVVKKDGTYYLFYDAAYNGTQINVATSTDGLTFTPDAAHNPVLSTGGVGTWDHNHIGIPYVFKDGATYYMTYRGDNGAPYLRAGGLAYSTDLVTWTKNTNNPYLSDTEAWVPKSGGTLGVEPWGVIKDGNTYYQFYSGFGGTTRGIGVMTTTDTPNNWSAASFTKDTNNPIFGDLNRCMEVFKYGDYFYGIVVYNASSLLLYRDTEPTFYPADREYVGIVKNGSEITSWTDGFPDVADVLVDDVSRSTFPDSNFKTYYAGEVDGSHWKQGLMQMSFDELLAALVPMSSFPWSTITGAVTISSGNLVLTGTTGTRGFIEQNTAYADPFQYGRVRSRFKASSAKATYAYPIGVRKPGIDTERILLFGDNATNNRLILRTDHGSSNSLVNIDNSDIQNWHTWEMDWKAGEVRLYQDATLRTTQTNNVTDQSAVAEFREGSVAGEDMDIDWIFAGKYVSPEPTYGIGAEIKAYNNENPSVSPILSTAQAFITLSTFAETATKNGGEIKYQVSNDGGTNWYWYNSGWATTTAGYTEANTASDINSYLASFPVGSGLFLPKAYLHSDGTQLVQLDSLALNYENDVTPSAISDLANDSTPRKSKTWVWSGESGDVFRFAVDQNSTWTATGAYGSVVTATQASGNGTYYLHVQSKDLANNVSEVTTVSAVLDNTAPIITMGGRNSVTISQGSTYVDSGATAADNIDTSVTVNSSGTVDSSTIGSYTITYAASDVAGNAATAVARTVKVVPVAAPGQAAPLEPTGQGQMAARIQYLRSEIARIQGMLAGAKSSNVKPAAKYSCSAITKNLFYGITNDPQVNCLQVFLKAQGNDIYPEAVISGNFLDATKAAVIRFQEKHANEILAPVGLKKGNGFVGLKTRQAINSLFH